MQVVVTAQRAESLREGVVIHDLQEEIAGLRSAHKALNRQLTSEAAVERAREAAAAALVEDNLQSASENQLRLELLCDELNLQVSALRSEVTLLGEEKDFVLQLLHNAKSESRAKVGKQVTKTTEAKAQAAKARKQVHSVSMQLQQAKVDKVANRAKFVTVKEGAETAKDFKRWGMRVLEQVKHWKGMTDKRVLETCRALCQHLENQAAAITEPPEDPEEGTASESAARKRAWRAKVKLHDALGAGWRSTLTDVLECEPAASIKALMPAKFEEIVTDGKRVFMSKLGDFWSTTRLLDMKITSKLSRRNYTRVRNCFFKEKNKATGLWEPLWIDDVLVVPPPGEKALRSLSKAIAQEYGLRTDRHGKMSMIDLNKLTVEDIMSAIESKQLRVFHDPTTGWMVTDLQGNKVCLQVVFDKANIHKLMSQTAVGVAYPNSSKHPCSPEHTHEFCVSESGDDWHGLRDNVSEALGAFNALKERGYVEGVVLKKEQTGLDEDITVNVAVDCTVGADQSGAHSGLGLGPCNSSFPCLICQCPQDEVLTTNAKQLGSYPRRSLHGLRLLAHLIPGDCPGCKARVVASKEDLCGCKAKKKCEKCDGRKMMVVAEPGDTPPTMKKADLNSWLKTHFGVCYARGPLVEVEPGLWVICILHMNLRITGAMFEHMIIKELGRHNKPAEREKTAQMVWEILIQNGIAIKALKCPVNNVISYWNSIQNHSFAGNDCAILSFERLWLKLLDLVMPKEAREANHTLETRYSSCVKAWDMWAGEVWPLINNLDFETKKLKANAVRKAAREFIPLFKQACAKTPKILYLHLLASHLPEQIETLTVDPYFYQTQGLEHRHKLRKQYHLCMTNHRKPGEKKVTQVDSYQWLTGEVCPAFTRSSGTSRGEQIMELMTVRDHLRRLLTGHVCAVATQVKLERANRLQKASWKQRQRVLGD